MRISSVPKSISGLACATLLLSTILVTQSSQAADSSAATATCERACLKKFVDDYATSMLQKNTASVPVAGNVKITENTKEIKLGDGIWQTATKFFSTASSTQYVADPDSGQIARMGILNEGGKPVFFAVRLKVTGNKISEIETLVGREGEAAPFQPEGYLWREAPFIREIPMKIRSSRQDLLKTAGTYWNVATTTHKGSTVPYSVDCIHVENGMNTDWERPLDNVEASKPEENPQSTFDGRIWTCEREVNLTTRSFAGVRNLRYIVDVERGLVMAWNIVDKTTMGAGGAGAGAGGAGGGMGAGGPPGGPAAAGVARGPLEYGPPSRGPDGWPAEGPPGGMGAGGAPGGAPGAGGPPGGAGPGGSAPMPQSLYHAALVRIVDGKIHREQFFQVNVPKESALPFN